MHAALTGSSIVHIWDAQTHLYIEGWTSSSLVGDSYRTGVLGGWGVCKLSVPQTVAHKSGPPLGARTAQASPLFRDKESLPPAWGLPERDSSSPRIGQLSWGGPRRTGGKRLGRSFGSLSSGCFLFAHRGALLLSHLTEAVKKQRAEQEGRRNPVFRLVSFPGEQIIRLTD